MPRLREVSRRDANAKVVVQAYDLLFGPDRDPVAKPGTETGTPGNWWTVFALVPDALDHALRGFRFYQSPDRKLNPVFRELGQTRTGWLVGSQFVFSQHCKSCRKVGVSDEKVAALKDWQVADCFTDEERTVLAYVDCLVALRGRVPDGIFAKLKSFLSDEEILELTYTTCMYDMHAVMTKALRLEYDDRDDPVVEIPAPADSTEMRSERR
jgi:alkylhydroperoxidase family enzyme